MRRAIYRFFSGGFEISGNAASFLEENEKKTIVLSSFLLVRSMGLAPQPYGRRRFERLFCAANAVAITPGTKNSALCCFLNVPFKSLTPLQKKDLHNECASHFLLVRSMGLEPIRSPIRPSNVRVCLFRHDRKQDVI